MYLLFDIGGTSSRIAVSKDGKQFAGDPVIIDTPQEYETGISTFITEAKKLIGDASVTVITGGIAGPFDRTHGCLLASPNLPQWVGKPVVADLSEGLHAPAKFENDSALVGLGEVHYGAGRGYDIVAYITVSTGVGGVRIENGRIDERSLSFEPGHQIIDIDNTFMENPQGNDLESYIGGRAIEKRMGKKPYEITDEGFWDEIARVLAVGLHNTIMHWSPEIIVLGGSMTKEIGIDIERTQFYLKQYSNIFPALPLLIKAELGDIGGLYGALVYAQQD